jgi:hypothetical protein
MSEIIELTPSQKAEAIRLFKVEKNLFELTKKLFQDESLDGRSKEGRALRNFLKNQNLEYGTTSHQKAQEIELTLEQKEFLMGNSVESGLKPLEIARTVFKDPSIASLSLQHRCVIDFLKKFRPEVVDENEILVGEKWTAPQSLMKVVKKINDWAGQKYDVNTLPNKQRHWCERLLYYLSSPRLYSTINSYTNQADRDLFESEFVRAVWDKPDLTNDELNLYVTICSNYVRQKHIQKRLDKLGVFLDDVNGQQDMTLRLTEILKTTSEELNSCEKRIESLSKGLNGDRQKRLEKKGEENGSIAALIEAFQDREERERIVRMAEMNNKLAADEASRLETMDEFKARVLGISKRELL